MRQIYFDNSATTAAYPEVRDIMGKLLCETYGNPSSMHAMGVDAERYVKEARRAIAATLRAGEKEIYFTSGGTESNNWALIGGSQANRRAGCRIVTSAMEHPSVSEPLAYLETQGFTVVRVGVEPDGRLRMDELGDALTADTCLVSVMIVNNEIGSVTEPAKIAAMIRDKAPRALFHADAVQAYGKMELAPKKASIDLLSVSGHKIHGPKGIGFLYRREGVRILPYLYGGGQQDGMRSGTDNVPGIAGLGCAAQIVCGHLAENRAVLFLLTDHLREGLTALSAELQTEYAKIPGAEGIREPVILHGPGGTFRAPHIVSAAFPGVRSEVLLHSLEERRIYVSAGSACSTHKAHKSPTLLAMGVPFAEMESTVRFSFCETNTIGEIDEALSALRELLPRLIRYRAK